MFERDFTDFLRYLTIERGLSRNTADAYRRDLEDYAAWLTAAASTPSGKSNAKRLSTT